MTDPTEGLPEDESPGPGWWKASDGRWYPPQPASEQVHTPQRGFLKSGLIVLAVFGVIIAFLIFVIAFLGSPAEDGEEPQGASREVSVTSGLDFG